MAYSKLGQCALLSFLMNFSWESVAAVNNGDFESWSGNTPLQWNTVDSGITVLAETNIVKSGNLSANVIVNTATQSNTDFQQQVSVEAGIRYDFSVWVYHTEGGIRARLVVDGYQNYSNPSLTQQWQKISYSYTASSTGIVNVGLRFYDVSGFDGSESVFVDQFLPSPTTPPPTGCDKHSVFLSLSTDNYGEETSWQITNEQGMTVFSGGEYLSNIQYSEDYCISSGNYTFTIFDSYGDGICCDYGTGNYALNADQRVLASGAQFSNSQSTSFALGNDNGDDTPPSEPTGYYASARGLTGYSLKSELFNIIRDHSSQGYSAIWQFYDVASRDKYFENDNSLLDRYSENPTGRDNYNYVVFSDQCGSYNSEADCYNREHSFPKSWFGGKVEPMNSDVHHIFASDGFVNSKRGSYPFGEVANATFTSTNGSKLGSATNSIGYSGTVFEPIDEFKGDFARAFFYMATRYENIIGAWQSNSNYSDAVLDGSSGKVYEAWLVAMLLKWHNQDPVSQLEQDRNQAAFEFQGNRNPYVDHPEFVEMIW